MNRAEEFTPYTSGRLHWFPYEITRCTRLGAQHGEHACTVRQTTSSVRRSPGCGRSGLRRSGLTDLDPKRWGRRPSTAAAVCDRPIAGGGLHQVWLTLQVATDALPLLVTPARRLCASRHAAGRRGIRTRPRGGARGPHADG
ncbi:hypothetical protein GCM10020229_51430 [Kitasatospora albolonga]